MRRVLCFISTFLFATTAIAASSTTQSMTCGSIDTIVSEKEVCLIQESGGDAYVQVWIGAGIKVSASVGLGAGAGAAAALDLAGGTVKSVVGVKYVYELSPGEDIGAARSIAIQEAKIEYNKLAVAKGKKTEYIEGLTCEAAPQPTFIDLLLTAAASQSPKISCEVSG